MSDNEEISFKLLLVEDDDDHVCIVERSLRHSPLAAQLAHVCNGAEALDFLYQRNAQRDAFTPDLMLLDLKLPGMSGFELLEAVNAEPRFRALPKVVFSTSGADHDLKKAYQLGANSYLKKPMEYDDFKQMIGALCTYWGAWNQLPSFDFSN